MSAVQPPLIDSKGTLRQRWLPAGSDRVVLGLLALGFALLYLPTYVDLSTTIWESDEQGHGPIILAICAWLLWQLRHRIAALPSCPAIGAGSTLLVFGLLFYVLGRTQAVLLFEVGSQIAIIAALLLLFKGPAAVKAAWFPLFFLIFMIPLPGALVAALTTPLKSAVSYVAEQVLYLFGYPIARSGVVLQIGPYQLLVADACAGLHSMFTLEALGLLYLNLMGYTSAARNVALAILVIPIAFIANVVRVIILVLVTYYYGDAAGQGFVHGFAGMVLFLAGLMLMLAVDGLLGRIIPSGRRAVST